MEKVQEASLGLNRFVAVVCDFSILLRQKMQLFTAIKHSYHATSENGPFKVRHPFVVCKHRRLRNSSPLRHVQR